MARYDDMDGDPRFDISCLNSMGTMIKHEVLENGTILLSKDANALYDFSERTIQGVFRLYEAPRADDPWMKHVE